MRVLIQPQTAHVAETASKCRSYQEKHLSYIAAEPSIVQFLKTGSDQRRVVLWRLVLVFPGIVSFENIEIGRCGFPFVVCFGL
jgi:hypothetical protein